MFRYTRPAAAQCNRAAFTGMAGQPQSETIGSFALTYRVLAGRSRAETAPGAGDAV